MSGRVKKVLEILFFLITCGTTYVLWFVPISLPLEVLMLLIGACLPGRLAVGGGHACGVFLRRIPFYRWIAVALLIVVAFILDSMMTLRVPDGERWIMVNGGLTAYLGLMQIIKSAFYLVHLFAPNKLHLSDKLPEE